MKKTKLQALELAHFRGATQPTRIGFDSEKKVTMIFGENGTGKSSIVDGFSFVCEQDIGSLGDRSGADRDLATSITGSDPLVRVTLTTDSGSWAASFKTNTKKVLVKPSTGCPDARILRRASILRLIEAEPSLRFAVLQEYFNVSQIEKCEKALGDAIRSKEVELASQVQAFAQAEEALARLWKSEGSPAPSAQQWAADEAAKDLASLGTQIKAADAITAAISDTETKSATVATAAARVTSATTAYNKALAEQKAEESKVIGQNTELLALLQKALSFLKTNPSQACPVCQQPADGDHLSGELAKRMATMTDLARAATGSEAQKRALDIATAQLTGAEAAFVEAVHQTASTTNASLLPPLAQSPILATELAAVQDGSLEVEQRLKAAAAILETLVSLKPALKTFRDNAQKTVNQQAAIVTQLQQLHRSRTGQESTSTLLTRLRQALRVVGDTRKAFVTEVLTEISTEVERLYTKLHPGEKVGAIRLSLDPKYVGSLYLHGDFHTAKSVTPQSIFSESHLDTLGLCVFLALAKRYKTDDTIIILDDVLTSVDAAHLDRFIELIHDEEQHFNQVIVTTHYRPWRDRYRNHRAPGNKVHFIELRPWTLESGIRVQGMILELSGLKGAAAATPFDRQAIASKAGIFLENVLEFLARVYNCRLPVNGHSGYTLRELSDCLPSKLLKALRVERASAQEDATGAEQTVWQPIPLESLIARVKSLAAVRNQVGCHYSDLGSLCTDAEVEDLAQTAIALGEALVCVKGGDFPSRSKSGSYHECRSKKVRLHPFEQPQ
jgi:energy-coupling factor transporter ATP-binding protein EcfA2